MSRSAPTVKVRAAAKINLHLGVGAPRSDGFHPLDTVYQAIGLYDDLTAGPGAGAPLEVRVSDHLAHATVPVAGNVVHAAVRALEELHGRPLPTDLALEKEIPVAGGMAGGSADAAAALVAVDRVHALATSDEDLLALAAGLGSDVPFALVGGTAHGTGRGELVRPVADHGAWWWVVVPSGEGLSTPEVYRHFDRLRPGAPGTPPAADAVLAALATGRPEALAAALHNDLQAAAVDLRPDLGELIEQGESLGALRGLVSGSGPTCLFLCPTGDDARDLAGALLGTGRTTVLVVPGAVAGAHVVGGDGPPTQAPG
jgi:4-diphosphocytidyl-2-C-methyl-D-erythritol kinase